MGSNLTTCKSQYPQPQPSWLALLSEKCAFRALHFVVMNIFSRLLEVCDRGTFEYVRGSVRRKPLLKRNTSLAKTFTDTADGTETKDLRSVVEFILYRSMFVLICTRTTRRHRKTPHVYSKLGELRFRLIIIDLRKRLSL